MDLVLVGAFKVKDGLFIGDEFAAQDLEFVVANKVTRIINCAARQVPNHWEPIGVQYLSFSWFDVDSQIILDSGDKTANQIYAFIESCSETGESILVHSVRGVSRCVCVVSSYLMKKYGWSLYKTLDFLAFRRPDIDINPGFLSQLGNFEARISRNTKVARTDQWDQVRDDGEELVLRNTYLNSRIGGNTDYHLTKGEEKNQDIKWNEQSDFDNIRAKNRQEKGFAYITSCLKGSQKIEKKVQIFSFSKSRENNSFSNIVLKEQKLRSASLNKSDNKLVKEAISAARNINTRPKLSARDERAEPSKARPNTAGVRRPPSPKVELKSRTIERVSSIKKKNKPSQ